MRGRLPAWVAGPVLGAATISVFAGAAQFGVTAVLADVAVEFGIVTAAQASEPGAMTAGTLGQGTAVIRAAGIFALFGATLADRFGRRRTLLTCAAIGLAATGLATGMATFWGFVIVVALSRPLLTTTNAVVPVVAAEEARTEQRTAALAFMSAAYAFGAGLIAVPRAVVDGLGFRPVLLGAAATIVFLPIVARYVRDSPAAVAHADHERPQFGLVPREHAWTLTVLCVLAVLTNLVTGPALTWLFVYGEGVLQASPNRMTMLVFLAGPVGLAGLIVGGWAGARVGRRLTSALGTALVPAAAVVTYGGDVGALALGYLVTIFALGVLGPPVAALLNELMPTDVRATANGWVGTSAVVGGVIGLLLFGTLIDAMPTYRSAAMTLFLPTVPLAFGYLLLRDRPTEDILEVDRLLLEEQLESQVTDPPS